MIMTLWFYNYHYHYYYYYYYYQLLLLIIKTILSMVNNNGGKNDVDNGTYDNHGSH